jgi:NAD(P)-dependent dehydrogenase (short-subunit alcohol dehydrogenase family)
MTLMIKDANWPAAIAFAALGIVFVLWLKTYLRGKQVWRYDSRAAWLRAFAAFSFAWAIAMASGTVPTILGNAWILPGQTSDIYWVISTIVLTVVVFVGYWIIWPIGTLPHGRKIVFPDTFIFGLLWGISEGLFFGSVWLLARRLWNNLLSTHPLISDYATCFTVILVLSAFIGMWHALYWDIHISPNHNIIEWNIRKVLFAHNPNLILGAIYITMWENLGIWVALQAFALLGSTLAMPFPTWRYPHPADPTGPDMGDPTDVPTDMSGQTVIVTGGANGMGAMASAMLADLGANVVILDKDEPNARANAQAIEKKTGKVADVIVADLSVQSQVRQAANDILATYPKIDVLINNAGIFTELYSEVENGVERTLANNHLGGFMLTQLLMTRLQESKARIIFVSSDAHRQAMKVNWDDINGKALWKGKDRNPNAGFAQYNLSKLFVASAAIELAERTKGTGVTVNTIAPGALIPTGIYDDATGPLPLIIKYFRPLLRQPEKAMITYIYLATSPEVANASGWYWKDGRFLDASQLASSQEVRDQVWEWSMRQTGLSAAVKS